VQRFGAMLCQPKDSDPRNSLESREGRYRAIDFNAAEYHRYFALQPILSQSKKIVGCEALFRSGWDNHFDGDSDQATRAMIDNWLLYGFEDLNGPNLTFLNCTREALLSGLLTLLPRWAVFEILETVEPDEEVLRACRKLKKMGYLLSLDDFESSEKMDEFLELADFIKIDFRITGPEERARLLPRLRKTKAILIAEKIETEEEFRWAKWEGFQLFQGYYFREQASFAMTKEPVNKENALQILEILSQSGFAISPLVDIICREPGIGCRLLRKANWDATGSSPVNTFRDALKVVGKNEFRKMVMLALLADVKSWDDLPSEVAQYGDPTLLMRTNPYGYAAPNPTRGLDILQTKSKSATGGKILKMPSWVQKAN
jgi:c-di-GMP-related signal transduction protein